MYQYYVICRFEFTFLHATLFGTSIKWNKDFKYSAVYSEKERDFFIEPELEDEAKRLMEDNFFSKDFESNRERIRLVYRELEKLQITSHYFNKVFTNGYPPHDGDYDEKDTKSLRAKLHEYWARYSNWYIISPVDTIQSYYGEEVGLYFAFMTLYTGQANYVIIMTSSLRNDYEAIIT